MEQIDAISRLIASYKKLPGIGNKTAERLAYATLSFSPEEIEAFIASLKNVEDNVHACPRCGLKIDTPFCPICDDPTREDKTLLVVIDAKNVLSFEKTGKYRGKYFILGGALSPLKGIGPENIRIPELKRLVIDEKIEEVILACSSTVEGELTANYINNYLTDTSVKITHLAYGLPVGADLEYVDELTIERSLKARVNMKGE
jgi:recombination protein RecR